MSETRDREESRMREKGETLRREGGRGVRQLEKRWRESEK